MATSLSSFSLSTTTSGKALDFPKASQRVTLLFSSKTKAFGYKGGRRMAVVASATPSTPPGISEKVSESIKQAEEACAGDAVSGECAAAWDEVEELSAAASHAREKLKENSDPLEQYCKESPEADECRTYED